MSDSLWPHGLQHARLLSNIILKILTRTIRLPQWLSGKKSAHSAEDAGDVGSIPGSGRSLGGGNGNPLQYSCQENPMDRGSWRATVRGVLESQTQLSKHVHLHLLVSEEHWMLHGNVCFLGLAVTRPAVTFCKKYVLWLHVLTNYQNQCVPAFLPASLEQFLRAVWNAASLTIILILPQIKLAACAFFKLTPL